MKELYEEINYMLDTTRWSIEEIADYCSCPVDWVEDIVEERWKALMRRNEPMSPFVTCNS